MTWISAPGMLMAGQRAEGAAAPVTDTGALEAIEASRQPLLDLLLDAVRAMGGANRRLPEAGGQAAGLAHLADAIETSRVAQAGAVTEVKRLLA